MVWLVWVATKEYQTSSSAVPTQDVEDWVAPTVVPLVGDVHEVPEFTVNDGALEQLLFVGGVMQVLLIVKVPVVVLPGL